jgi:prepilin-type N-terminal cleavage/methylation domain-containing protein
VRKPLSNVKSERGFTIIEVMVAIVLLLLGVLGVATMADNANGVSTTTKARVGATNLAREVLEDARTFSYADLTGTLPAGSGATDLETAFAGIEFTDAFPSTTGFQIKRRQTTYTVSVFTCILDDAHDGVRAAPSSGPDVNAAGPYCLGSPNPVTPGTDANPDDARKVEVSVSWTIRGIAPSCRGASQTSTSGALGGLGRACVTQSELIANPSGGLGPAIKTLVRNPPGTVEAGTDNVVMNVTTASTAQSVSWTADDGSSGAATAVAGNTDGTQWTFTWGPLGSLSPKDGSHILTAQAFLLNAGGVPKETAVKLNRFIPAVPQGGTGGVDTRIPNQPAAALSWPQSAPDVIGYTVYRASGAAPDLANDTPVCSTLGVGGTACFDAPGAAPTDLPTFATTPACPATALPGDKCINYYVVPFDEKWTTVTNPSLYTAGAECGNAWASVTVPSSPRSVPPLSTSPTWLAGNARTGCPSAFININYTRLSPPLNNPPGAPGFLTCSTDNGQPKISWTPASPDSDTPSDPIVSYRIYRKTSPATPGYNDPATTVNSTAFKDSDPVTVSGYDYYVTAVDARFQESSELHIAWTLAACP